MIYRGLFVISILFLLLSLLRGCSMENMRSIMKLQESIQTNFGHRPDKLIIRNENVLIATFVNSKFGELTAPKKKEKAQEIAEYCTNNYLGSDELTEIVIVFENHTDQGDSSVNTYTYHLQNSMIVLGG